MIGLANTIMVSSDVTPFYTVDLSPGSINVFSSNGAATSPTIYSTVNNGVGPFEYLWVSSSELITINSPTNASTRLSASGNNTEISANITLTVTDTGNGNAEAVKGLSAKFSFSFID